MKKLLKLLEISAIVLFCAMSCTMSANAQGSGGKAGTGGKGGFGGGQASSSFTPGTTTTNGGCDGTPTCNFTMSVTAGQFVVFGGGIDDTTSETFSVSDTNGDSFTAPTGGPYVGTFNAVFVFFAVIGTTNASETFTCQETNATPRLACVAAVYTGTPTSGWDVAIAGNTAASTGCCSLSVTTGTSTTTAQASELGIAILIGSPNGNGMSWVGTSGWTFRAKDGNNNFMSVAILDNILSSTQTLTGSGTLTVGAQAAWAGMVSSIK